MEDLAYTYFKKAAEEWLIENNKTQNWLALEIGVEDGTISRYLTDKRNIPFNRQLEIAKACGFEYLAFLQLGKNLLTPSSQKALPSPESQSGMKSKTRVIATPNLEPELEPEKEDTESEMKKLAEKMLIEIKELNQRINELTAENATLKAQLAHSLGGLLGDLENGQYQRPVNE